nr:11 kDa late embryogenesis abundant protein-like [Tanacetum cinerariifolium]
MMFSGNIHVDDFVAHIIKKGIPRKDNKYQRRMQTANAAASIKETTTNIGVSAKTSMEKTKATLQVK